MIEIRKRQSVPELMADIERLTFEVVAKARREAQYADMAGEDSAENYRRIRAALGSVAMRACRELKYLAKHEHSWNSSDYCDICGADGRA